VFLTTIAVQNSSPAHGFASIDDLSVIAVADALAVIAK
jgi:hypothetical protein